MGNLNEFFRDLGRNAYGLGENAASLASAAIAEPVAGYAAMFDPVNGADAIREGMTYQPRSEAAKMYQRGAANAIGQAVKPAMPIIDTWQQGVDIAGRYSPTLGAMLKTTPTALGVALGAKPALQTGRQVSNSLGALQQRAIANASAPRTLNMGFRGQRGVIGTQRPLTEFEQAHLTAQRNAALPINQGGLGLAPDNTAMDRARAMGFDVDNPVYHGTNWDFVEFNRVGEKANALGLGHYTTPNPTKADMYGDRVMPLLTKNDGVLDWGGLTESQRKEISANLKDRVPPEQMAGYAPLSKKQFPKTDSGTNEAKAFFREKQKETSNYFHDRAKPNIVDDGDNWAIEWRDPTNMDGANNQELLNLSQRFDPDMANALGYKGAKFGDETAIYDPKNIRSRFAAFDPMKRESANLLAQSAKFAPAATLGALMANEKRKDKRN
jgi:hypothetical protein